MMSRKFGLGLLFVAAATGLGLFLSRGPWTAYRQQKQKADAANQTLNKAEIDSTELLRQRALIESPIGREELARKQQYLKKGESPIDKDQ